MKLGKPVDPKDITLEEGKFLVKLAREAVRNYLLHGKEIKPFKNTPNKLLLPGASFVTILTLVGGKEELRGCIGYIRPIEPLAMNVIHAAIAAATQDPRFLPMEASELDNVVFEVSVLSVPELLEGIGKKLLGQFVIGRDGLIVDDGFYTGLLLPEVPVEYCWDEETFLSETCIKAGLHPDCWMDEGVRVYRFRTKTFKEISPGGDVQERDLRKEYISRCGPVNG